MSGLVCFCNRKRQFLFVISICNLGGKDAEEVTDNVLPQKSFNFLLKSTNDREKKKRAFRIRETGGNKHSSQLLIASVVSV
jgi:hypothetical protein